MTVGEEYVSIYHDISGVVGIEKLNRILLLERAVNQKHWAKGLQNAVQPLQKIPPMQIERVLSVIKKMESEASGYENRR